MTNENGLTEEQEERYKRTPPNAVEQTMEIGEIDLSGEEGEAMNIIRDEMNQNGKREVSYQEVMGIALLLTAKQIQSDIALMPINENEKTNWKLVPEKHEDEEKVI